MTAERRLKYLVLWLQWLGIGGVQSWSIIGDRLSSMSYEKPLGGMDVAIGCKWRGQRWVLIVVS